MRQNEVLCLHEPETESENETCQAIMAMGTMLLEAVQQQSDTLPVCFCSDCRSILDLSKSAMSEIFTCIPLTIGRTTADLQISSSWLMMAPSVQCLRERMQSGFLSLHFFARRWNKADLHFSIALICIVVPLQLVGIELQLAFLAVTHRSLCF